MSLQVVLNKPRIYRILLECYPEGVFVNVFESSTSPGPIQDHYQPDLMMAKRYCKETFDVNPLDWVEVPDETWH